jgi:hypothetical protein
MWFSRKPKSELEARLYAMREQPSREFVRRLERHIDSATRVRGIGSRLAFAGALVVFVSGAFASLGGLTYAETGASQAIVVAKRVIADNPVRTVSRSSASDQYGDEEQQPVGVLQPPAAPPPVDIAGAGEEGLPFTGAPLFGTALAGAVLIALGLVLRRRERRSLG